MLGAACGTVLCLPALIRIYNMLADADIRLSDVYSLTAFIQLHAMLGAFRPVLATMTNKYLQAQGYIGISPNRQFDSYK